MALNGVGIHWFRRDLRVAGNPALQENFKIHHGNVVGLFCFDSKFLSRPDFSHHRFAFFLNTIEKLRDDLRRIGSDLLVLDERPGALFPRLIGKIRSLYPNAEISISFNRDYEPFARARESEVSLILSELKVRVISARDHLIIEPHELVKDGDKPFYQVYTPFSKKWLEMFKSHEIQKRIAQQKKGIENLASESSKKIFSLTWKDLFPGSNALEDQCSSVMEKNRRHLSFSIPESGTREAYRRLSNFVSRVKDYSSQRDLPAIDGTSQLSHFLKNGSWSNAQTIAFLEENNVDLLKSSGPHQFLKEIIWREFYYHILYHCPNVESEAFLPHYRSIVWENSEKLFAAWCEGKTGYPIVDAGMRQLKTTGWMHNRVRMIVASFLTKDLLIDWRWGERHFMKYLLDGDLAPNNGGWQWAASTGCDPQPYFRIFNPALQSAKFDPNGEYIKRYIPELAHVDNKLLHDVEDLPAVSGYPKPVINHKSQKIKALALYKRD